MLTDRDREFSALHPGTINPERVRALRHALTAQADSARAAAERREARDDTHAAAALRGKALAYRDAATMVGHVAAGHALHPRSYSAATLKSRMVNALRRQRRTEAAS